MANKAVTSGLVVGIAVAIVMASAALVLLVNMNAKIDNVLGHEKNEHLEVGAPGLAKNEFYIFT